MLATGRGEIHFYGDNKEKLVEFIDSFTFPVRDPEESVPVFKARVTAVVKHMSQTTTGREIIAVKWIGPLGYHHGYVLPR